MFRGNTSGANGKLNDLSRKRRMVTVESEKVGGGVVGDIAGSAGRNAEANRQYGFASLEPDVSWFTGQLISVVV